MSDYSYSTCPLTRTILLTGLHTAFLNNMEAQYSSTGELHNFWEIIVVLEGEVSVATDKDVFSLKKHQLAIHPPLEFHRHFNSSGRKNSFAVLSFDADRMPMSETSVYTLTPYEIQEFASIIRTIRENFVCRHLHILAPKCPDSPAAQEVISRCELLWNGVFSRKSIPRQNASPDYTRIVEFLSENTSQHLTLPDISRALNMSQANIKRIFSKYSGLGIMTYFKYLKIQHGIALLKAGSSVKEVSDALSYSSPSAFSTSFRKVTGLPPSSFRA